MAQNVANRLQRNVRPQQAHCPRIADGVWSALTFCLDTGLSDATAEHCVKTGPTGKGTSGSYSAALHSLLEFREKSTCDSVSMSEASSN